MTRVLGKTSTSLGSDEIRELIPHRWPMLLLDRITALDPGVSGTGVKNVTSTELWFQGHFPEKSVLPGIVIIESLAQLSGVVFSFSREGTISYLAGVRSMRFRRTVTPGDSLILSTERLAGGQDFAEYRVHARVDQSTVAEGIVSMSDPTPRTQNGIA